MKIIHRLFTLLFIGVCGLIVLDIGRSIREANRADLFSMIEAGTAADAGNMGITILGMDAYMFLMMVGLLFAVVLAVLRKELINVNAGISVVIALTFFLQAYLGAKILCGIEHVIDEKSFDVFTMDGQSLYGTIPMTLLFILLLSVLLKRNYGQLLDYVAPLWLTLLAFVRLGCFVTGCCGADPISVANIELVLPVQLFEVACDLILLWIIFNLEKKNSCTDCIKNSRGASFFIMIGTYGVYRFVLEFLRSTPVVFLGMTYGQIYSLICIIAAVIYMIRTKRV